MDLDLLAADIRAWSRELGFQQIGITDTDLDSYAPEYRRWLARRFHAGMDYMQRNRDKREHPERLHPGTVRVISARMDYLCEPVALPSQHPVLNDPQRAYIARYALGRDYHKTVRRRLAQLARRIDAAIEGGDCRAFTDSAPVLEKPLAAKAGLGWQGKNTLVLNEHAGSFFFLGEIFTNLALPVDANPAADQCGSCRACLGVCPTDAIVAPGQLDASRCISYLTIENKGPIPEALRAAVGNRVFGCDDCQLICPWNRYAKRSTESDFEPRHGLDTATLTSLLSWDEAAFARHTEGSALRRLDYSQWLRNLAVAAGNAAPSHQLAALLVERRQGATDMVIEHIDWALARQVT